MSGTRLVPMIVDVAVVGGGAVGAATAWVLARRGASVVLVEAAGARAVRDAARGTAWSAHPGWDETLEATHAEAVDLWRALETETGAAVLRRTDTLDHGRCRRALAGVLPLAEAAARWPATSFTGPVSVRRGAGIQVHADQAIAALTAAAAGHGAVLRHRAGTVTVHPDEDRVEVRTGTGRVRARRAVVTTVAQADPDGVELHFAPGRPGLPLIAHRHEELGLVRAAPCAGGHLAVSAAAGADRLREYARAWFPGVGADQAVAAGAWSTANPRLTVEEDGPVVAATTDAVGSVAATAWGRLLADTVMVAAPQPAAAPAARARVS